MARVRAKKKKVAKEGEISSTDSLRQIRVSK
jgi:hypothetical protein